MSRVYLDNAATSWPKPEAVYAAIDTYQRECGAAAGRGSYRESVAAAALVAETRRLVAKLLGTPCWENVVFTSNGTDSLNLALHGLLSAGDHVITSVAEHNSILRPLRTLMNRGDVTVSRVGCDGRGYIDVDAIRQEIRSNTTLIAVSHASNVTGAVQPIADISLLASEHQIPVLVDAAQSLGHWNESPLMPGVALVAAPGHKGLYGPMGTGFLYVAPELAGRVRPVRQGGTGTDSESDEQPATCPQRFEAGNLNLPGIVGMRAGLQTLQEISIAAICCKQSLWTRQVLGALNEIASVRCWGPSADEPRVAVISFTIHGFEPEEVSGILETSYGIQSRAGLHCSPAMHESLGTSKSGGTVRVSCGLMTPEDSAARLILAVREIAENSPAR